MTLDGGTLSDIDLQVTTKDFAYDAPLDLRSLSDGSLRVSRRGDDILVVGQVTIDEGGQTGDINFDEGLLAAISARPTLDLTEERNPLLERIRFNVDVDTATPILVDNNLAQAEVEADAAAGRDAVRAGADRPPQPARRRRDHARTSGATRSSAASSRSSTSAASSPSFDLLLNTTAGNYDITIAVTGEPGKTETTLTSDPTLPEPDIMALLVTGRTLDEMRGEEYEVAREQVLSYLSGRVGLAAWAAASKRPPGSAKSASSRS